MLRVRNQIGLTKVLKKQVLSGMGIGIGVLDSGIFLHSDINEQAVVFRDFISMRKTPYDDLGHGTHICGILAGNGKASNGKYRGIAPDCILCVGKILDEKGVGSIGNLLRGMEWLLQISNRYHIKIINISISSFYMKNEYEKRELINLLQKANERGILVVTAAGNSGPDYGSISLLGDSIHSICVSCHDGNYFSNKTQTCHAYSSRGPGRYVYKKPDLVAPGTDIVSLDCSKSGYIMRSGTSMATPIVSATLALGFEKWGEISNYLIKKRMLDSATDLGVHSFEQGAGMLDAYHFLCGYS